MNGDLDVVAVGDAQAAVDGGRGGAPVLVQLQTASAGPDLFLERSGQAAVALAEKAEVQGKRLGGLQHALDVPGARRAGRGVRAGSRPGAASQERGQAGGQGRLAELRADKVDVAVDAARGDNEVFPGDDLGARPDDQ